MPSFSTLIARRAIVAACLVAAAVPAAFAQSATGSFLVVHGIPGRDVGPTLDPLLPVDVLVNGSICLIHGLNFKEIAGPFTVPAATYDVKISLANSASPCGNSPVIDASVAVGPNSFASVVAALSSSGAPTAYAFANDLSSVNAGGARIIAAHAADAPAVDVTLKAPGLAPLVLSDLTPGTEGSHDLPGNRSYTVAISATGTTTPVIRPSDLSLPARSVALAYAVGSLSSASLTLLTKIIPDVF